MTDLSISATATVTLNDGSVRVVDVEERTVICRLKDGDQAYNLLIRRGVRRVVKLSRVKHIYVGARLIYHKDKN